MNSDGLGAATRRIGPLGNDAGLARRSWSATSLTDRRAARRPPSVNSSPAAHPSVSRSLWGGFHQDRPGARPNRRRAM